MGREYKITEENLSKYMRSNHLAHQQIIGESGDNFILKTGNGMRPLPKAEVEKWSINEGLVPGLGMSEENRTIYEANKKRNTVQVNEKKAYDNTLKDENLDAYRKQTKEYRLREAQQAAYDESQAAGEAIPGVHYKPYKSGKR